MDKVLFNQVGPGTRWSFTAGNIGRFPFDQKFRKFRVWERMEQTFPGISFRNFGCTSRGWPKIPENRNNRKIPFHSTIPARAQFLRARKSRTIERYRALKVVADSVYSQPWSRVNSISKNEMNIRISLCNVRRVNGMLDISLEIVPKKTH